MVVWGQLLSNELGNYWCRSWQGVPECSRVFVYERLNCLLCKRRQSDLQVHWRIYFVEPHPLEDPVREFSDWNLTSSRPHRVLVIQRQTYAGGELIWFFSSICCSWTQLMCLLLPLRNHFTNKKLFSSCFFLCVQLTLCFQLHDNQNVLQMSSLLNERKTKHLPCRDQF